MKKIIVLDFDGVFYSGKDVFINTPKYIAKNRRSFFYKLTDEEYDMICRENPILQKVYVGQDVIEQIYILKKKYPSLPISVKGFLDCQEREVYDINLTNAHIIDRGFVEWLCNNFIVYIVSNSSISHLKFYLKKFNIDFNMFKKVISNQFEEFDRTKKHYYQEIIAEENISPKDLYVFGDSENSDLNPAREIGANGILIKDANDFKKIVEDSLKKDL